ncbi:SapC family protein [Ruegeria atlantica]|uniref:SapC family protein n=1 Tax=Ruegeria atlantica TaxID=81569 RepID=UPI00147B852F|nr:SapC family protein [Ruegeria atlantica]
MEENGLVPVTVARHGRKYWKRFTSYKFAADRPDCAIVLQEVAQAAAAFPIIFKKTKLGIEPRVILSLSEGSTTPFVSQSGQWLASYVPSDFRCYPFQAEPISGATSGHTPTFRLNVDEASGLVTTNPSDEAFFDTDRVVSSALNGVKTFLQAREATKKTTLELCQKIAAMDLFEQINSHRGVALPNGSFGVSAHRLESLTRAEKLNLLDSDGHLLLHAHQISLSHCEWLERAQRQISQPKFAEKYTKNSDVSDFLCAMANVQNDEFPGISEV